MSVVPCFAIETELIPQCKLTNKKAKWIIALQVKLGKVYFIQYFHGEIPSANLLYIINVLGYRKYATLHRDILQHGL